MGIPQRIQAAIAALDLGPEMRGLEIGCGRGVAAAEICPVVASYLGADRSAKAIAAAERRCSGWVEPGLVPS